MTEFLTLEQLTNFSGLVIATVLVLEGIKRIFNLNENLEGRYNIYHLMNYITALVLLMVFNPVYYSDLQMFVLGLLNAIVIAMASGKGYDEVKKLFTE